MELPKNIVQIGKPDKTHKIFVEDYVISYIKQLNRECNGKAIGLALYGKYAEENDCKYYFLYGASRVEGIEHRGPYLSQTEKEEIGDIGNRYFAEYRFLAWCSLKGEPVESFFVQAGEKGMQVEGYACFYEKNESMLNFMLMYESQNRQERTEEALSAGRDETVSMPSAGHTERAQKFATGSFVQMPAAGNAGNRPARKTEYMKVAVAAVFLVLCVVGITTLNDYEKMEDLQVAARQVIANLTEQKLPDAPVGEVSAGEASAGDVSAGDVSENTVSAAVLPDENTQVAVSKPVSEQPAESIEPPSIEVQPAETQIAETQTATESAPVAYVIAKGDTLISICKQKYGSLDRFAEICRLNGIADADSIQIGQTILLPQ